jgi:5S rRNA maturation endonuclease (ribonuclease M5)
VLPTFGRNGSLVYAQTRYLDVELAGRKYDNPSSGHATKPALSWPRMPDDDGECTIVCEGVIDALTIAGIRIRSVALLSASDARHGLTELASAPNRLVIATDPDGAGQRASRSLQRALAASGVGYVAQLELQADVNDLARQFRERFEQRFRDAMRRPDIKPTHCVGLSR